MKIAKKISFLLVLFTVLVSCKTKSEEDHSNHINNEITFYTCSMHPQIKVNKPGKCPICHMELIPIKGNELETNEISLSQQQILLGNITTQTIEATQNSLEEIYTGILTFNQENITSISSRGMGRIEKLYFKTIGDYIKKNDIVYELYSEEIAIAKQDFLVAYQQLSIPGDFGKNATILLQTAKQKLIFYGLTDEQIENIKTSEEVSPYTTFYSKYSGYITDIITGEGSYTMEGSEIIKLAELSNLWLEAQINANYSQHVRIGQFAKIYFTDFPELIVQSRITFINPEINSNSRLLLIRLDVPNQNLLLKPGMQAIVKFKQPEINGLFIPTDAIIREENATYIWVEKEQGVFENIMVEIGIEINGLIEIKTEIDSSKKIVITGAYGINSEYKFRKRGDPMEGMKM